MPRRGEIWWFDPDPVVGRELGRKVRPGLIVSTDEFNDSGVGLVIVVPSTTQNRPFPSHVVYELRGSGGSAAMSFCCEFVRAISAERLRNRVGDVVVPQAVLLEVERILRRVMGI